MSVRIGIGSAFLPSIPLSAFHDWIALCEDMGIDSIWPSDFLLQHNLEPLTVLAAIAARTTRMRLGTNALLLPLRDPLLLAKQIATLAYLSDGRFFPSFALAAPWDPAWAASWLPSRHRGDRADEAIALIRALLRQEEVTFTGSYYRYEGRGVEPRPRVPVSIWVGGESAGAIRRTAMLGDGWLGAMSPPDRAGAVVAKINAALEATGRTIEPDHYGVSLPFRIGEADNPAVVAVHRRLAARIDLGAGIPEAFAVGKADAIVATLRRYIAAGVSKFVVLPMVSDHDDLIDQTRRLARDILPVVEGM
jgi:probable F420-dependent oxidoreductase